ncbi:hypothetical protein [Thermococcus aciditolerans]|uniref:Uncharacterized protein n=1 Tax=Thermococcus aciditolerans TaxID=2598455 RepID=A0A5C0SLK6_9EURY|nr:hypothetical protein [Thermococcus aciditolerans]QEK14038.1 hypothetical protein FPV09_01660 [Thermococcus aciditolerans]
MEIITSRLKLISLHPFKDYTGVVHSGDALFLVEPVGKVLVAFLPDSEDVLKLVGRENSYVDVVISLQYSEATRPAREKRFLLEEEPRERGLPRYRIIGRFRKVEGDCGVFECGNLRFEECFSGESEWIEEIGAWFYAYLPERD